MATKRPSPEEHQDKIKELQDLASLDPPAKPEYELTDRQREEPEYQRFCACVLKHTSIPDRDLAYLWFLNRDFRLLWYRGRTDLTRQDAEERALLVRCIARGIVDDQALGVIHAWWEWHKLRDDDGTRQVLWLATYRQANEWAQNHIAKVKAQEEQERKERLASKARAKTIEILRSNPGMTAKQISDTLAKDAGVEQPTKKDYENTRRQLSRMVTEGHIVRVERGRFALPEGGEVSTPAADALVPVVAPTAPEPQVRTSYDMDGIFARLPVPKTKAPATVRTPAPAPAPAPEPEPTDEEKAYYAQIRREHPEHFPADENQDQDQDQDEQQPEPDDTGPKAKLPF